MSRNEDSRLNSSFGDESSRFTPSTESDTEFEYKSKLSPLYGSPRASIGLDGDLKASTSEIEFAITLDNVARLQRALEKESSAKGKKGEKGDKGKKTSYESIFEIAVKRSKVQICKFCLKQDPTINVNKEFASFPKSTALMQSIKTRTTTDRELYKLLLSYGADPKKGDEYFTPIQKAITNQDTELIDALVEAGLDLEEEDQNQSQRGTALWFALHMNCFQSFIHLIKLGANVNAKRKGRSLLHYVSEHREIKQGVQVVKTLLDNHADIEAKDLRGMTPFLHAVDYGRVDIMTVLRDNGANTRALDSSERNALTICVDSAHAIHHLDAVEFVLGLELDDNEAIKSLQSMVDKIGSPIYLDLANTFINNGKKIKLPQKELVEEEDYEDDLTEQTEQTEHIDQERQENEPQVEYENEPQVE